MLKGKMKRILIGVLATYLAVTATFTASTSVSAFSPENVGSKITATTLFDGQEIYIVNDDVREILDMDYFDPSWIKTLYTEGEDNYFPVDLKLQWNEVQGATYYNVRVATDRNFENVTDRFTVIGQTNVSVNLPLVNTTYYWQVETEVDGNKLVSGLFSFKTADTPRVLDIDGVTNTRDLGGYTTSLGVMRQGMVIRSARLEGITSQGLITAKKLGIKTDLDFRSEGEDGQTNISPLGSDVNYINIPGPYYVHYTDRPINSTLGKESMKSIMQVFANANNYPINMHCSFGKDRTGTIAFILSALCGASEQQLKRDFWLSVYSKAGAVKYEEIENTNQLFEETYRYINGQVGRTYAEKTENYLKSAGVTQTEIDAIKANLLITA
jgi:protein tyrosine/serine phosphatase